MNDKSQKRVTSQHRKGNLFVISAPSGAGKGTVISKVLQLRPEIVLSVSATTRAPRSGESNGTSYHFVTRDEFAGMISNGDFLEYAEYVGEFYGTPKKPIERYIEDGKDVLLEIEVQGAKQIMEKMPEAVTIFIIPPDIKELERRLKGRGTDVGDKLKARLDIALTELKEKENYDHIVVNDDILIAAKDVLSIIDNQH